MLNFALTSSFFKVLNGILPIVSMAIFIESLGIGNYGLLITAQSIVAILLPFLCLNVQTPQRKASTQNSKRKLLHLSASALILVFMYLAITIFVEIYYQINNSNLGLPKEIVESRHLIIACAFLIGITTSLEVFYAATLEYKMVAFYFLTSIFLLWIPMLIFVIGWNIWEARIYATIFLGIVISSSTCIFQASSIKIESYKLIFRIIQKFLREGSPLFLITIANVFSLHFDRIVIASTLNNDVSGYYLALSTVTTIIFFGSQALAFPIESIFYKNFQMGMRFSTISTLIITMILCIMLLFSNQIFTVFTGLPLKNFEFAFNVLTFSNYLKALTLLILPIVLIKKRQSFVAKGIVISSVAYVLTLINFGSDITSITIIMMTMCLFNLSWTIYAAAK